MRVRRTRGTRRTRMKETGGKRVEKEEEAEAVVKAAVKAGVREGWRGDLIDKYPMTTCKIHN